MYASWCHCRSHMYWYYIIYILHVYLSLCVITIYCKCVSTNKYCLLSIVRLYLVHLSISGNWTTSEHLNVVLMLFGVRVKYSISYKIPSVHFEILINYVSITYIHVYHQQIIVYISFQHVQKVIFFSVYWLL